ncbi:MAG: anthranilate synthase component I family protein [Phycisphaeraceae bacterium]
MPPTPPTHPPARVDADAHREMPVARLGGALTVLHSARPHERWAQRTIVGRAVEAWRLWIDPSGKWAGERLDESGSIVSTQRFAEPFEVLAKLSESRSVWAGYVGYEAGRSLEGDLDAGRDTLGWPVLQVQRLEDVEEFDAGPLPAKILGAQGDWRAGEMRTSMDEAAYSMRVRTIIEAIRRGDLFQTNLTYHLDAEFEGCARAFYADLVKQSPAWFGGLVELLGPEDEPKRVLTSISPELFLEFQGPNVTTRPIKGTASASNEKSLLTSEKDAAELNMIVDVLRNDLGRSAHIGSVRVEQNRHTESHPTISHAVATVTAALRKNVSWVEAMRLASPGGSITGAPKIQAMKLIDHLEPDWRGPYCGSIGYVSGDRACWNIAIRTAAITQDRRTRRGTLRYGVGGGIVADSDPAAEWQETLLKAEALKATLRAAKASQPQEVAHRG